MSYRCRHAIVHTTRYQRYTHARMDAEHACACTCICRHTDRHTCMYLCTHMHMYVLIFVHNLKCLCVFSMHTCIHFLCVLCRTHTIYTQKRTSTEICANQLSQIFWSLSILRFRDPTRKRKMSRAIWDATNASTYKHTRRQLRQVSVARNHLSAVPSGPLRRAISSSEISSPELSGWGKDLALAGLALEDTVW
jgi:hypothetical protein